MQEVEYLSLPTMTYRECWQLQRQRAVSCRRQGVGAVIFVEHPPVITLGRAGRRHSIVAAESELQFAGIELVHSDRGGDVTYHGPGQLVVYPILDLGFWKKDVRRYLRALEEVTLRTLADLGIPGYRCSLGTGVWVDHPQRGSSKIASMGIHLSRWISSHGVALNVSNSLEPFRLIVPCGLAGVRMTSVSEMLGHPVARSTVENLFWTHLVNHFHLEPVQLTFSAAGATALAARC